MPSSDPVEILLVHNRWATQQLLDACAKLSEQQLHQRFDMGPGSLHDTLTHIVSAMQAWAQSLAGEELQPRLDQDGRRRTPGELQAVLQNAAGALAAETTRQPLHQIVTRVLRDGKTLTLTRGAALAQVTTHGMHHRAQCLNMLRQLGVTPLPPSSIVEWTRLADGQGA